MSIPDKDVRVTQFRARAGGVSLAGSVFSSGKPEPSPAVFLLHGIPRSKPEPGDEGYRPMAESLAQKGFAAVFFNFRGTGQSSGNFHMLGWAEDLAAAIDHVSKMEIVDKERIAVAGFSGGAAAAIYTAARDERIRAVVAVSCPASFETLEQFDSANEWTRNFREIGLFRDKDFPPSMQDWKNEFKEIAPIKWVDKISPRPLLLIHGEMDELVPGEQAEILFKKAGQPKKIIWIKEGPHRLRKIPEVTDHIIEWIQSHIKRD